MRLLSLIKKTMIENFRDWKILILILTFAPFFVFLMYFYFGDTTKTYNITVVNHDQGVKTVHKNRFEAGKDLITQLKKVCSPEGKKILKIQLEKEMKKALEGLENKSADMVVEIPGNFSRVLFDYKRGHQPRPAIVKTHGNSSNIDYIMAAVWSDIITYQYVAATTGWQGPLELQANPIDNLNTLNEFDLYVPGLLVLSIIMLMFTAAASIIKEKDKDTIIRLRISRMTTFEWLSAVSITQIFIGLLALGLAFLSALAVGYETTGSVVAMMVVGLFSSLSVMGISVLVAALLRTVFDLMTIGCFPFFILMFFSGSMFPLPQIRLFYLGNRSFNLNDILPTTHTIAAFNKILNFGASLEDVTFEIGAIMILTVIFFGLGTWLFIQRHMRA
ncbi:MAG: ABC transporter permease [Candidatus Aminicenantes bacterium]|nr:ABC transporter permease [Candidatus Aminicenantes bacterium]